VNQLYDVSNEESIPPHEVSSYIKQKLEDKQKIDEQIKQADAILQSKNVNIEAINEHIRLKEELKKYRLSTKDIRRLLDLLEAKLRNIKRLENKENKLKNSCDVLSKQADKYKQIIPLARLIWDCVLAKVN
jgi:DNA repair ATPase RecN